VDRSIADESDVALVDLPSTSGAHWANRDREALARRPESRQATFRRPPAVNSFLGDDRSDDRGDLRDGDRANTGEASWDAFAPTGRPGGTESAWEAFGAEQVAEQPAEQAAGQAAWQIGSQDVPERALHQNPEQAARHTGEQALEVESNRHWTRREAAAEPAFGPAPPTGPGRASYGVTAGPISGARPDLPTSPAPMLWSESAADPAPGAADEGVGDFINGPGREIRAHRAARTPESVSPGPEKRRSRLVMVATIALTAVVLLGGAVAGVAFFAGEDQSITSMLRLGSGDSDGKVATASIDGRTAATFEVVAATTKVTVRMADLGADLYKITSAGDSGSAPSPVIAEDRVQLLLSRDGDGTSGNVEVVLSTKVGWALRFIGGADEQIVNLTGGKVSSIDLSGGSRRVDLILPQPAGTVPVRVTGAVDELSVTSPAGSPVRVQVDSGAKTVAAGDKTLRDVKPGSTLTPKDWKVPNRYDVDAASRITLLTVRSTAK
jgi:hypothetical protein